MHRVCRNAAKRVRTPVLQHEVDHLEGILFIDQLTAHDRIWHVEEGQEEQAEIDGTTEELAPADFPLEFTEA